MQRQVLGAKARSLNYRAFLPGLYSSRPQPTASWVLGLIFGPIHSFHRSPNVTFIKPQLAKNIEKILSKTSSTSFQQYSSYLQSRRSCASIQNGKMRSAGGTNERQLSTGSSSPSPASRGPFCSLIPTATLFHVLTVDWVFIWTLLGLRTRHTDPCKHGVAIPIAPVRILLRVHIADAR